MTAKNRKRLLIVISGIGVIAALLLHYKQRDSYRCQTCFCRKDVFQWRFGSWTGFSVPLTAKKEQIVETRFLHDLFPTDHVHVWEYAQGSPYHFFGTTWSGCGIGSGRHVSDLFREYESSPEFRAFIEHELQDGSLSKSNFTALVSVTRIRETSPNKEGEALLEQFLKYLEAVKSPRSDSKKTEGILNTDH